MPTGKESEAAGTEVSAQTTFEREFAIFCKDLQSNPKNKNKLAFVERIKANNGTSSPEKIEHELQDLVKQARTTGMRKAFGRIQSTLGAIKDYTGVIETMIQAFPFPTTLIWGGLKIVFECAGRGNKQFDLIKDELWRLTDVLFELSGFEEIHGTSLYAADAVQRVLSSSYQTLLKFWYRCTKILEHPGRYIFTTNTKLQSLVEEIERNCQCLSRIRAVMQENLSKELRKSISAEQVHTAAERAAASEEREKTEAERQENEKERKRAEEERRKTQKEREQMEIERQKTEDEREKAESRRVQEQNDKTWNELDTHIQFKEDNELNYDAYHQGVTGRHSGTCNWLFETNEFKEWAADNSTKHTFWLSGKHGAGKSFLCSSAIEHITKTNKAKCRPVFRFLTKDFYVTRNQILRHLASQLLSSLRELRPQFPDSLRRFIHIDVNNSADVQNLIRTIVAELPVTYIFIDGLDEPEYADDNSRPAPARGDDVKTVIEFLIGDIAKSSPTCKLWLSSQPLPEIRGYVCRSNWSGGIQELSLQTKHTEKDILSYLDSAIGAPTSDNRLGRIFVKTALASEVEGSFLWVNTMLKDLQSQADDDSELLKLAEEGLPTEMNKIYTTMINRLQSQQKARDGLPLWKIALSLITFAKRPLRMGEVIEALAMTRTELGHDLNPNKITSWERILSSCKALIRHQVIDGSDPLDSVVRLSHSAVRTFLVKNSDETDKGQYVTSQIIKDCCLRYWMQPRYRRPLIRTGTTDITFQTHNGEEVKTHRLLNYAAKYWYQHFHSDKFSDTNSSTDTAFMPRRSQSELAVPLDADRLHVTRFLRSSNFQTCLQVQCLFVVGHFIQQFNQITDEATFLRRTLPNWIPELETETHRQYADFQKEWCHVLVPGWQSDVHGELDRCFWTALGPSNFLSGNKGRYRDFQLQDGLPTEGQTCQFIKTSSDGRAVMVGSVEKQGESDAVIRLEKWTLDGISVSKPAEDVRISLSLADANIERYWTPSRESFRAAPLVPNVKCVVPPTALALWLDTNHNCRAMRFGSQLFQNQTASTADLAFSRTDKTLLRSSAWEDTATMGPYLVVCRRRVPRPEPPDEKEKEAQRVEIMKARCDRYTRRRRAARRATKRRVKPDLNAFGHRAQSAMSDSGADFSSESSESDFSCSVDERSSESDSSDSLDEHSSDSSESDNSRLDCPSAEESWSEGSTPTEDDSSDSSIPSPTSSDDEGSDSSDGFGSSGIAGDDSDEEELDAAFASTFDSGYSGLGLGIGDPVSSLVNASHVVGAMAGPDSTDGEYDESESEDDEFLSLVPPQQAVLEHEAGILPVHGGGIYCDGCGADPLWQYYHCIKCKEDDFDLCCRCERRGRWCFDQSHQLFRMVASNAGPKAVWMATRCNFRIRQEIMVFQNGEQGAEGKVLFYLRKKYSRLLYQSPPAIHPQHHLVVWPLTGRILLFADFQANKFFEQKIKSTVASRKAREICVNISFSPCGRHLRVATIEAEVERIPKTRCHPAQRQARSNRRVCLNLHVAILQLSPSKPTRNPPKLLHSTAFRIGPYCRTFIQQLPFTFTWRPTELFVTMSDLSLRVYRIQLPDGEDPAEPTDQPKTANAPISSTLTNKIYLPRSSKHRSVQYFPPHVADGNSTVIIGPRYGRFPAPAIGVYLTPEDLGGWVAVSSGEEQDGEAVCVPRQAIRGQLEDFDREQDCDIIPFEY